MATKRVPGAKSQNSNPAQAGTAPPAPEAQAPQVPTAPEGATPPAPAAAARMSREAETREAVSRKKEWVPPQKRYNLRNDDPNFRLRWLRMEINGQDDTHNMETKFEEGYELVSPDDPLVAEKIARGELHASNGRVYRKGLVLARIPTELAEQRNQHYAKEALLHQQGVSQALHNEADPRMPIRVDSEQRRTSREG